MRRHMRTSRPCVICISKKWWSPWGNLRAWPSEPTMSTSPICSCQANSMSRRSSTPLVPTSALERNSSTLESSSSGCSHRKTFCPRLPNAKLMLVAFTLTGRSPTWKRAYPFMVVISGHPDVAQSSRSMDITPSCSTMWPLWAGLSTRHFPPFTRLWRWVPLRVKADQLKVVGAAVGVAVVGAAVVAVGAVVWAVVGAVVGAVVVGAINM
mmetsp:Transcript_27840/g.63053  ORF Transcript_27840/g.63053 Transcript_27840/m.63053 type:complete len:210 (+) Transcript_27840:172-801(+)